MRTSRFGFVVLLLVGQLAAPNHERAQSEDELGTRSRQVQQLYEAGKYADALDRQRALVTDIDKAERASAGSSGTRTVTALGVLAWYALFARSFDEALEATERAHALAPDLLWIEMNRAHALLFMGRPDEARVLYLAHKGKRMSQNDDRTWEDATAEDFEVMRKAGLDHAAIGEIAAALGIDSDEFYALKARVTELFRAGKYGEATQMIVK